MVDSKVLGSYDNSPYTMRNNLVLKKVGIFIWRTQIGRLPVKIELDKRGIDLHSVRCDLCDEDLESVMHCLIDCSFAKDIWSRVFSWWDFGAFSSANVTDMIRDKGPISMSSFGCKVWQDTKWITLYLIWKNRNNVVFQGKSGTAPVALNEIQNLTFEWITSRAKDRCFDWLTWLSKPKVYLNML
ncbi:uncharacterized protein [Rutidosis leptorrhynchoides]|uniref:uncharacterized protein n=1 Tax=Rutidosis leptorrhynchoides TaxID=125765 RepID=UPI003A99710B